MHIRLVQRQGWDVLMDTGGEARARYLLQSFKFYVAPAKNRVFAAKSRGKFCFTYLQIMLEK
jgi:hypothetical protein